jgi:hypothetical protein
MTEPKYTPTLARGAFVGRRWHAFNELWPDDAPEPRLCVVCKTPTVWKRPRKRGAATHPMCEGTIFDTATDELYMKALFIVAATLGAAVIDATEAEAKPEPERRTRPFGRDGAGCELCGRNYAALWVGARTWRCPKHPPADDTYRRRTW